MTPHELIVLGHVPGPGKPLRRIPQIAQFSYADGVAMEMCPRVLAVLSAAGLIDPHADFQGRVISYRQTESGAKAMAEGVVA